MRRGRRLLRRLSLRQIGAIVITGAAGLGVVGAALWGSVRLEVALVGLLAMLAVVGIVQVRRRLGWVEQGTKRLLEDVDNLTARIEFAQRRMLSTVEKGRLEAADRHREGSAELMEAIRRSTSELADTVRSVRADMTGSIHASTDR